ncbi:MAG: aldo/keto reductase [Trueperaceae bacterium]|nr:aldo/keto reductase [Trueperaceae bacterium]
MKYRQFGSTDLRVSEVCFGTMRFAAKEPGRDEKSLNGMHALEEALERGVNCVHSSYEYGTRWATGEVMARYPKRDEVHHVIKVNVPDWGEERFDKAAFRAQVEDALRDLHAERIAVVQHLQRGSAGPRAWPTRRRASRSGWPTFPSIVEPLGEVVEELTSEGKIGHLATFPYTVGYARAALETGLFEGVVAYFDLLETEMLDLFPELRRRGAGFIGIRPLMGGLLTDKRIDRAALPAGDRMNGPEWDRAYDQLEEAKRVLGEPDTSWTELALRFSLTPRRRQHGGEHQRRRAARAGARGVRRRVRGRPEPERAPPDHAALPRGVRRQSERLRTPDLLTHTVGGAVRHHLDESPVRSAGRSGCRCRPRCARSPARASTPRGTAGRW